MLDLSVYLTRAGLNRKYSIRSFREPLKFTNLVPSIEMRSTNDVAPPARAGIGMNSNEWEAPKRLSSVTQSFKTGPPSSSHRSPSLQSGATKTTSESSNKTSKYGNQIDDMSISGHSSRILGDVFDDNASVYSDATIVTQTSTKSNRSHLSLTSNAMHRAGYLANENQDLDDYNAPGFDPNEEDEDFDREFYLSEEGQTTGFEESKQRPFIGNEKKFKEREEQMSKGRARGDVKIAG